MSLSTPHKREQSKIQSNNTMGNRAVIRTKKNDIGVYLHWQGGRDSVRPFLAYCKMKDYRAPEEDSYGWAYLCQVICNFFNGSGLSIGIDRVKCLDCKNGDNGVYIIKDWEIVGREFYEGEEQDEYDFRKMMHVINSRQPVACQESEEDINNFVDQYLGITKTE